MDYSKLDKKQLKRKAKEYIGWYASIKFDGWRITYDPVSKTLRTKGGNVCKGVSYIAENLSKCKYPVVEGELYIGRQLRSKIATVCAGKEDLPESIKPQYLLFDMPSSGLNFYDRQRNLQNLIKTKPVRNVTYVDQFEIKTDKQLIEMFKKVTSAGGEGLVLSDPNAEYSAGRSKSKVKLKGRPDAEATVVGHKIGEKGRLILKAVTENGVEFYIFSGLSHTAKKEEYPIGIVFTFEFENMSSDGVPQQPSFVSIRPKEDQRAKKVSAKKLSDKD